MDIYSFQGIHLMPVQGDKIGFPALFFIAIQDTRAVVVTHREKGLFGYSPKVWQALKESLYSRYESLSKALP